MHKFWSVKRQHICTDRNYYNIMHSNEKMIIIEQNYTLILHKHNNIMILSDKFIKNNILNLAYHFLVSWSWIKPIIFIEEPIKEIKPPMTSSYLIINDKCDDLSLLYPLSLDLSRPFIYFRWLYISTISVLVIVVEGKNRWLDNR